MVGEQLTSFAISLIFFALFFASTSRNCAMMRMKTRAVRPPLLPPPATLRDFLELPFFTLRLAFVVCHLVARLRLQLILVVRLFGHFLLLPGERRRRHRDPMKCAAQYGLSRRGLCQGIHELRRSLTATRTWELEHTCCT